MGKMLKGFAPVLVFVVGMILILLATIFFPAINSTVSTTQSSISSIESNYWGLHNVLSSVRTILLVMGVGIILVDVAVIWLKKRNNSNRY